MPRQDERRGGRSSEAEPKKPVFDCRAGKVKAAVWENEGRNGTFPTVTFSRIYKGEGDKWKTATSFNVWDLADLARCAFSAEAYCRTHYSSEEAGESGSRSGGGA